MAHYALLDNNNVIVNVIVGKDEDEVIYDSYTDTTISDWEEYYSEVTGLIAKRTSYNTFKGEHREGKTPFRGNYAQVGGKYDPQKDIFIPPKPDNKDWYELDETGLFWKDTRPYASENTSTVHNVYVWNETTNSWDLDENN